MTNKKNENTEEKFEEFYIAVKSPKSKNDFIVYASDPFKFSEIELINLIKICVPERRNKSIGEKLLAIYEDSTSERKELTKQRLKYIGINENAKPTTTARKNPTLK